MRVLPRDLNRFERVANRDVVLPLAELVPGLGAVALVTCHAFVVARPRALPTSVGGDTTAGGRVTAW